jgi:soluble lytic murein transglycosylase-like protein
MIGFGEMMRLDLAKITLLGLCAVAPLCARAAERVTLANGFEVDCVRREVVDGRVRLYTAGSENYLDVSPADVVRVETGVALAAPATPETDAKTVSVEVRPSVVPSSLTRDEMHTMLSHAGNEHNIDEDLLASLVKAESGGHVHAISRTGARGLMQLMPRTASDLGVKDSFQPDQNIAGGSAYLDALLSRYHDNVALALAAYNAGPKAVDRYHGVPPYRETQSYVARVIREFNRRKQASRLTALHTAPAASVAASAQGR